MGTTTISLVQNAYIIKETSCETVYQVGERVIRLWIITGGTPALGFDMTPFENRFPKVEKWGNNHWLNKEVRYDHQISGHIVGPRVEDVLPGGWSDFWVFYDANISILNLWEKRWSVVSGYFPILSKKVLDKVERTFVIAKVDPAWSKFYVSPVTFTSKVYCGRCDEKIVLFSSWWVKAQGVLNRPRVNTSVRWDELSDLEFMEIVELFEEGIKDKGVQRVGKKKGN